ncbi:MAG: MotA/TolQ/ExbB proton channel family protein [Campylobacterales bacterium]|nr:MotA/TolQ/ExbB proton channel family protein [Campylobacterales bacterium]NQY53219.1 MotA/TolQ/ExbB proton channel family protein [Campylobacteraceae bacterium]
MIKYILSLSLICSLSFSLDLESLLAKVKNESKIELDIEKKRLDKFLSNKYEQKILLDKSKRKLLTEEKRSKVLKKLIEEQELILIEQEKSLSKESADLGEMFGSLRQSSSDFLINFQNSLTASQDINKEEFLHTLANSKKLANINELKSYWIAMLDEIIKSSNIEKYQAQVILNSGEKVSQEITRVGLFSATSEGKYFTYSSDMKSLVELAVQPSYSSTSKAKDFENAKGISSILIDPTRGTLLKMIENNPSIMDRINQGGIVGFVILVLGGSGLIFAFYKMILLNIYSVKIKKQRKNLNTVNEDNALGKIAKVFYSNINDSLNDLEIKVGEAILKESNKIQKGQSFVKLLAAVTPLLGLLGTVTGMITTFQAITLFGTGDPKLMAGGISTALITTVLGLVTAIPLLFAYTYISSKAQSLISILEEQSIGLLAKNLK